MTSLPLLSECSLTSIGRVTRATPLPPDERRAALIAATEPLLEQFGREVSTRQIAEAASVAEGTIFRAFPTKEALIDAVLNDVFDVQHTCDELARIDLGHAVEARLVTAVGVLQARLHRVFALFHSMRLARPVKHDHAASGTVSDRQRRSSTPRSPRCSSPIATGCASTRSRPPIALRTVTFAL